MDAYVELKKVHVCWQGFPLLKKEKKMFITHHKAVNICGTGAWVPKVVYDVSAPL